MKRTHISLFLLVFRLMGFSQQAYFADGYHGGVYGHYPVEWQTRFMVDRLNKHPEWKINLEIEPETWDTVKLKTPDDYENLKKMITDKRIDFTNPTYAQPYCYNISGESIIRQLEYGIKKINHHFPDVKFTTYAVEEPCFTSALPQILKLFGFKYAVLKCPDTCWGGYMQAHGKELVNWIGPDGTSILTVPRYACEKLEENTTWQTIAWANSDAYIKACLDSGIKHPVGMCYQDAGWENGPWLGFGENIKKKSAYVTWTDYIENISDGKTDDDYFLSQEDVLVNLMWGSQVLQKIGQEVRRAENNIIMAEKLGAMAYLENNYSYPQDGVDEAWRTLMLAQHHDSWIVPYNRLKKQQKTWAEEITLWTSNTNAVSGKIIKEAVESFDRQNTSANNQGFIRVYNTLGINRKELVSLLLPQEYTGTDFIIYDTKNKEIPFSIEKESGKIKLSFKADVPPFGYATYGIKKGRSKQQSASRIQFSPKNECVLENDMYKIVFDASKGGTIKSLVAKKEENKEYVSQTKDYLLGELRGYFYEDEKFYSSQETPAKITILEDNLLEKSILIEGEIATHPFSQIVTIARGERRIDFDLTINWKYNVGIGEYKQGQNWHDNRRAFYDDRFKLNVLFPVHLQSPHLYKDAPFDVCESRLDNTFFNTWDGIKHDIILHWVDLSETKEGYGLALFSDHTTSYAYGDDFPLGLTAQYSGIGLWGVDYKITGPLQMKYAILPHKGKWDEAAVSAENSSWNEPLICSYSPCMTVENKSWIDVRHTGYDISSAQIAGNAILVRLYNAEGDNSLQEVSFGFPVSNIEEVDLNGKPLKSIAIKKTGSGSDMSVAIPRFGLRTFLVKKEL